MAVREMFLSIVVVVRNQANDVASIVHQVGGAVRGIVTDYELIVVDNGSTDETLATLRTLTGGDGVANLQVFGLTKSVGEDAASWVGVENSLGDHVVVIDPLIDDVQHLAVMLDEVADGVDVVFSRNERQAKLPFGYRVFYGIFTRVFRMLAGVDLRLDAPHYRVLSRRVVNFILQHPQPAVAYRHLPVTGGFSRVNLSYTPATEYSRPRTIRSGFDRAIPLLISTTKAPLRIVLILCVFGASSNVVYSIYVLAVAVFKSDVAPGWISLSLQQSGMFFLLSLVLLVLGEYVLHSVNVSTEGPAHHVAEEFTSARITRLDRLNVEVAGDVEAARVRETGRPVVPTASWREAPT